MAGYKKPKAEADQPELPLDAAPEVVAENPEAVAENPEVVTEAAEPAPEPTVEVVAETPEVVVVETKEPPRTYVCPPLPTTEEEQLAGQIALAAAEERLKAELAVGAKAVAEAEARMRAAG